MRYLLDTNVLSELRKPKQRASPAVKAWATTQQATDFAISIVSIMEIDVGIRQLGRRDPLSAGHLNSWLEDEILGTFRRQILPVDVRTARAAAGLQVPNPRPKMDALIAATALVNGLTVVTRNVKDLEPMGVPVINPWEAT